MTSEKNSIRIHQIRSFCAIFPDSCVILHYIFHEEEFLPKIEFLLDTVADVPCEILPQVNTEIAKKLFEATNEFGKTIDEFRKISQSILNLPLDKVIINKKTSELIEEVFKRLFSQISRFHFPTLADKDAALRRTRVIEASLMLSVWNILNKSETISLDSFLKRLEDGYKNKYIEFCDKQSVFMDRMNAKLLKEADLFETTSSFYNIILKCGVKNKSDVKVLCQAIGRMYKINKWCAVVTTDYTDIVKNSYLIEKFTLLRISDPLYCIYHLDRRIDLSLKPTDEAAKNGINYKDFFIKPKNIGVV